MMTNSGMIAPTEGAPSSINWLHLWTMASSRAWLFVLCFFPVVFLSIIYLLTASRVYESTAVVQVEQHEQRAFKSSTVADEQDDLRSEEIMKTIEQNFQNYDIFFSVANNPKIANDPDLLVGYPGSRNPVLASDVAGWLQSNTKVGLRHGTRLINVSVDHQNPAMAQKLVRAVIEAFVLYDGQTQNLTQNTNLKYLEDESLEVKDNLQKAENSLQIYKESLALKDRIDDQQRVIDDLSQKYDEGHPQLIEARRLWASLMQSFAVEFNKVLANSSSETEYWASDGNEVATASPKDRTAVALKMVVARADILQKEVDTESALYGSLLRQKSEVNVSQHAMGTEIRLVQPPSLPSKPAKPKKTVILFLGVAGGALLGGLAIAVAALLDSSIQTPLEAEAYLELPVLGIIPQLPSKKLTPASVPAPANLNGKESYDLKAYISHRAGEAYHAFSTSVITAVKESRTTEALISLWSREAKPVGLPGDELVMSKSPSSAAAEAFRSLRATLNLLDRTSEHRSFLFTSALPGDGKTFVSCNFALSLAQIGLRTLLVDADLRRPVVHTRFQLENKTGFFEVATKDLALNEAVQNTGVPKLDILTAGGHCPNPAECLGGPGFKSVLTQALAIYDCVVFDTSPVNLVSDSLLIAAQVNTVCLVLHATNSPRRASRHAVIALRRAQKEPTGIILNSILPENDRHHRGYKRSDTGKYGHNYSQNFTD